MVDQLEVALAAAADDDVAQANLAEEYARRKWHRGHSISIRCLSRVKAIFSIRSNLHAYGPCRVSRRDGATQSVGGEWRHVA